MGVADLARQVGLYDQASSESVVLKRDLEHYMQTLSLKDEEIAFLRGHLSQISEKLLKALPRSTTCVAKVISDSLATLHEKDCATTSSQAHLPVLF